MGKHNGKARKGGISVGSALVNKARKDGRTGSASSYLFTTKDSPATNMQSVIENNDLQEMMSMVRENANAPGSAPLVPSCPWTWLRRRRPPPSPAAPRRPLLSGRAGWQGLHR
jgi:hypothetical protein